MLYFVPTEEAKANAPCVIFIDELDSVGGKRIESPMHPYSRQTINQLLAEMDGLVVCAVVKVNKKQAQILILIRFIISCKISGLSQMKVLLLLGQQILQKHWTSK